MSERWRILVADDIPFNAEMLAVILSGAGYQVDVVHDAVLAVAKTQELRPDCIFMDVVMPGEFNGIEAIRRIRTMDYRPLIICQSAQAGNACIQEALDAGADECLVKPFKRRDVLEVLERYRVKQEQD